MIFHSLDFLMFFVAFVAIYWALPQRGQNVLLFVGSYLVIMSDRVNRAIVALVGMAWSTSA